jgi:branched-subunit amino acid aminotransferase/4-amino-4-deoxychorismate lyase
MVAATASHQVAMFAMLCTALDKRSNVSLSLCLSNSVSLFTDGKIMEGLSSNVLVVLNGTVYTAKEGVLLGTVRDIIMKVCRQHSIPVVEEPPCLDSIAEWEGCLVSSTSRLALPVGEVQVVKTDENDESVWHLPTDGLVARIDQLVLDAIESESEPY